MLITISNRCAYKLISYLLTNKKQKKKPKFNTLWNPISQYSCLNIF